MRWKTWFSSVKSWFKKCIWLGKNVTAWCEKNCEDKNFFLLCLRKIQYTCTYAGFWVRGLVLIQVNPWKVNKSGCARSKLRLRQNPYTYMKFKKKKNKEKVEQVWKFNFFQIQEKNFNFLIAIKQIYKKDLQQIPGIKYRIKLQNPVKK